MRLDVVAVVGLLLAIALCGGADCAVAFDILAFVSPLLLQIRHVFLLSGADQF